MAKFEGLLVKNIFCDVRGGYDEADVKVNQILIDLQKEGATIERVEIVSADKGYAIFTLLYKGVVDMIDEEPIKEAIIEEPVAEEKPAKKK